MREITDAALPGEDLSEDELSTVVDEGTILATADGAGAVLIAGPGVGGGPGVAGPAVVALVAVVPAAQGEGRGRELLGAAAAWARERGAATLWAGSCGSGPGGPWLWPGVEVHATRALCLFESAGYRETGTVLHAGCPTTFRQAPPAGTTVRRVLEDHDAADAVALAVALAPSLAGEVARAIEHGSCLLATNGEQPVGVGCHSVHRVGWVGPLLVAEPARRRGIGAALLAGLCADLRAAGRSEAEIAWAKPLVFYARTAGASVSRVYRRLALVTG